MQVEVVRIESMQNAQLLPSVTAVRFFFERGVLFEKQPILSIAVVKKRPNLADSLSEQVCYLISTPGRRHVSDALSNCRSLVT
jgi:hypothetical protein